jgi:hypothetical protein
MSVPKYRSGGLFRPAPPSNGGLRDKSTARGILAGRAVLALGCWDEVSDSWNGLCHEAHSAH